MTLPWRSNTTDEISTEADSRYETPGGAQAKVDISQEYLLHLLKLAVTGLSNGSEAAIARYSTPYDITYEWLKDRLDAADNILKTTNEKFINFGLINVKDFGAIGNGQSHPLSSYFTTLEKAKSVYPFVTSLTQEIDCVAIQKAINYVGNTLNKGEVFVPNGTYLIDTSLDFQPFSSESGKPCSFKMDPGSGFVAVKEMNQMINISGNDVGQFQSANFEFSYLNGQSYAVFVVRLRNIVDSNLKFGIIQNGTHGLFSDMSGSPAYGNFNNKISILKIVNSSIHGFYCIGNIMGGYTEFQGNIVDIRQIIGCGSDAIKLNDNTNNRCWYNLFTIGAIEFNGGYGIYVNSGKNQWIINSTNNNVNRGFGGANNLEKNIIQGYLEDGIDSNQVYGHDATLSYPALKNGGKYNVTANVIPHGLVYPPSKVFLISETPGLIVTLTSVDFTNITIAITDHTGSSITSAQNIWWSAEV